MFDPNVPKLGRKTSVFAQQSGIHSSKLTDLQKPAEFLPTMKPPKSPKYSKSANNLPKNFGCICKCNVASARNFAVKITIFNFGLTLIFPAYDKNIFSILMP